ncbi:16S rRNA (guanine(527)-N(7))-methyltransferase RsmG [Rhodobacteraceae bacterium D3-12]|nr:16S rRNA (guanine(527)-N(7))-methyltransferase RsmG [Rhodobacteraceae bacterium D3-12]
MPSAASLDVSRETFERLELYAALLAKWNPRINLVAKSTIPDLWTRHIVDSLQVFRVFDGTATHWADLGSGGGFPGLVIAIAAAETGNPASTTLVESDQRKATFLRTVIRETGIKAEVIAERIEAVSPLNADVISARALADLGKLMGYAAPHLALGGVCLFQKGKNWKSEVQTAREAWQFSYDALTSTTESDAVVLKIKGLSRV